MLIDLQLSAGAMPWPQIRDGALAAEEAGFGAVWTFDHLSGAVLRGHTMLECFSLMGALAAATSTIGIGSLVVNVANRPAGVLAAAAASVQAISGNRLVLGLGAGTSPRSTFVSEQLAVGMEVRDRLVDRHAALVDALDLLDAVWRPDRGARFDGFALPEVRPPMVLGVNSEALATIAGRRADGVNVRRSDPNAVGLIRVAQRAHADAGRVTPFEASMWTLWNPALLDGDHPDRRAWVALGVDRLILTALEPLDVADIAKAATQLR